MDRADFESAARRDGYTIHTGEIKPNELHKPHVHDFDARLFVLSGAMTLVLGDDIHTFGPGNFCSVQAGTSHAEQCGADGVRYLAARRSPVARAAAAE
jgi:quercetin dioxygenase-like cupin family protein